MRKSVIVKLGFLLALVSSQVSAQTFTTLQSFNGITGAHPYGSLTLNGSTLYGMTENGGNTMFSTNMGTIFSISTSGSDFQDLHSFDGFDGQFPCGSLLMSGSTLYGMATEGGGSGAGSIFLINTSGTGFQSLYSLSNTGGSFPYGSLTLNGSTLYGMTEMGGNGIGFGNGTIFSISTSGTSFQDLHLFNWIDGSFPEGSLLLNGSTLYGMTSGGGSSNKGTIFSISTSGTGFQDLYSFSGTDGATPIGSLLLSGSTLYGMTENGGGINNDGTIFSINISGTGFQDLHSFNGTDGINPMGDLTLSDSTLYGMTYYGGANGDGTIFSLTVPEPSTFTLLDVGFVSVIAYAWRRRASKGGWTKGVKNQSAHHFLSGNGS
jgi:uncharacterized repeat protein (TIGR03803 family)